MSNIKISKFCLAIPEPIIMDNNMIDIKVQSRYRLAIPKDRFGKDKEKDKNIK